MRHLVCCRFCRKVLTAQSLTGHMRAMHMRGRDQRAAGLRPAAGGGRTYIRCPS